nr:hypothetical protein [Tissierella sp.]
MKSFLRVILLIHILFLITGCKSNGLSPLLYKDEPQNEVITSKDSAPELDYTIDKVTLSKSYQTISPTVEVIKNGLNANLLLSLGVVESTGVTIEKIERKENDIIIYINNENEDSKGEIVVPQVLLHLTDVSSIDIKDMNFKIINQNYTPIKANIDIGEAISKIQSSLKFSSSTFPETSITMKDDKLFLDLKFVNAIDLTDTYNSIINLNVLMDITDGKIVKTTKESVSSLIDRGNILEYASNKYIFYEKETASGDERSTSVWIYNILKDTKEKIYSTKNKINSLKFNKESGKLLLLESFLEYNELYILDVKDLKAYKVNLDKNISPTLAVWKDPNNIILIDKDNTASNIYNFNVATSKIDFISRIDQDVKEIKCQEDNFIFTSEDERSKEVYITKNFKEIKLIDKGLNPIFLNNSDVAYLKHDTLKNKNILWVYNIDNGSINSYTDIDIKDFFKWGDNLGIIEKNQIGSDNPLHIYNFKTRKLELLTSIKSDKVFLNTDKNILYVNFSLDLDDKKIPIISFIEL